MVVVHNIIILRTKVVYVYVYDDCMTTPNEDLANNEMKDELKPIPRISINDKQLNVYYN